MPFTFRKRQSDIAKRGTVREQVELLEHHADTSAQVIGLELEDAFAIQQDVAAGGFDKTIEAAQRAWTCPNPMDRSGRSPCRA